MEEIKRNQAWIETKGKRRIFVVAQNCHTSSKVIFGFDINKYRFIQPKREMMNNLYIKNKCKYLGNTILDMNYIMNLTNGVENTYE